VVDRPEPIFIVGVSQRAGTHFLYDLLSQHPDCAPALPAEDETQGAWEDYLLDRAEPLIRYRDELAWIWSGTGLPGEQLGDRLLASLGEGLTGFLAGGATSAGAVRRPVTKTPAAGNLDLFPKLFPRASLVLIARHPHAVVASAVATFGGIPERWVRIWRAGARSLLDFQAAHPGRAVLVRYEDLVADLEGSLRPVLDAVGLDPGRFDFAAAASLPARGSSAVAAAGVAWQPVPVADIGDPLGRGEQISPRLADRIAWLAGAEVDALGYDRSAPTGARDAGPRRSLAHRALDARWAVGRGLHRLAGRARPAR
jgi:hypothetical protein